MHPPIEWIVDGYFHLSKNCGAIPGQRIHTFIIGVYLCVRLMVSSVCRPQVEQLGNSRTLRFLPTRILQPGYHIARAAHPA
jgi:hypothetical protein